MAGKKDRRHLGWSCLAGALLAAGAGAMLIYWPLGDGLARLSYDLPFLFQRKVPDELVIIYIDAKVKVNLGQPTDEPLDRRYHTQLVERLTRDGAKLIYYDLLFDSEHPDPKVDAAFAAALQRHGRAVLVADYIKSIQAHIALEESALPPIAPLQNAAAGWGLARLDPDPDHAIREVDPGIEDTPSAPWVAATLLGATPHASRLTPRWLNYYCAPPQIRSVNFDHALSADGLPAGYFSNKIAVIGSRPSVGVAGTQRDEFGSPFSRFGRRFSSGAEVHGITVLNLLRGDWIKRLSLRTELLLAVIIGCALGAGLLLLEPWKAIIAAVVAALAIFVSAAVFQLNQGVFWSWAVPVSVQAPVALLWAVGWRYFVESKRQRRLRRAFSVYLSPYMADRIAQSDFDLQLGGQQVYATVLFTDLAGFTAMSEKLPPSEVSNILTTYFTRTTRHILERNGTIIKYMGDAVMAVWGAPLPDIHHARDAVLAACHIIDEGQTEIAGRHLRTRIGINTGPVLAGNLGSAYRFDYTAIGATTNLASRLEGLNKILGTEILITEETRKGLPKDILLRYLGRFVLSGTSEPVQIHEVAGRGVPAEPLQLFSEALGHWSRGELPAATALFQKVIALRGGHDGPSEFYLSRPGPADAISIGTK